MTYAWCEICERPIRDEWWLVSRFQNKRHVECDLAFRKRMTTHDAGTDVVDGYVNALVSIGQQALWIEKNEPGSPSANWAGTMLALIRGVLPAFDDFSNNKGVRPANGPSPVRCAPGEHAYPVLPWKGMGPCTFCGYDPLADEPTPEPGTVPFADQGADILAGHDVPPGRDGLAADYRDYMRANLFDGDEYGVHSERTSMLLDRIVENTGAFFAEHGWSGGSAVTPSDADWRRIRAYIAYELRHHPAVAVTPIAEAVRKGLAGEPHPTATGTEGRDS